MDSTPFASGADVAAAQNNLQRRPQASTVAAPTNGVNGVNGSHVEIDDKKALLSKVSLSLNNLQVLSSTVVISPL
jgi:hypothetical protein